MLLWLTEANRSWSLWFLIECELEGLDCLLSLRPESFLKFSGFCWNWINDEQVQTMRNHLGLFLTVKPFSYLDIC